MPLKEVPLRLSDTALPSDVQQLLRVADEWIDEFHRVQRPQVVAFIPSNYATVFRALRAITDMSFHACHSFCEWGSGFGVITSLASMLELNACGIEVDATLVAMSQQLAREFGLPVEFIQGSFVPPGGELIAIEAFTSATGDMHWLETHTDDTYDRLGLDVDDFDLIFAYPWPGEHHVIERLFDRFAAPGALLLTYDHADTVRLQRKFVRPARR